MLWQRWLDSVHMLAGAGRGASDVLMSASRSVEQVSKRR